MLDTVIRSWLPFQCQMIPKVTRAVVLRYEIASETAEPAAWWPQAGSDAPALLEAARSAIATNAPALRGQEGGSQASDLFVGCPLGCDGYLLGAVAVQIPACAAQQQKAVVQLLQWGSAWLELLIHQQTVAAVQRSPLIFETLAAALKYERFQMAAAAAATELARLLPCERVGIGFLKNKASRLHALSDSAGPASRTNLTRAMEDAMDEALAQGGAVVYPPPPSGPERVTQAHARLAQQAGATALCTVPLLDNGRAVGAVTLERSAGQAFDPVLCELCAAAANTIGPILELKRRQDRAASEKAREYLAALSRRVFGPRELRLKFIVAASIACAAFLIFAAGDYRIAAPATLEGTVQRAVVAPYDGFVAAAYARAGEAVAAGEVIAELDDRDLRLEQRRWASRREELEKQFRKALADLDHVQVRVLRAQIAQAEAQLGLLDEQLERTRLIAPIDGVVISGDLSRSLDTPVERGQLLFEIAPLDKFRVALEVADTDIADVVVGQRGHLVLSSLPGERFSLVVENISTVSETEEGQAKFRVEAGIAGPSGVLRPGMQGIGKIEVGERKFAWLWTRRLVGWLRLWLWSTF